MLIGAASIIGIVLGSTNLAFAVKGHVPTSYFNKPFKPGSMTNEPSGLNSEVESIQTHNTNGHIITKTGSGTPKWGGVTLNKGDGGKGGSGKGKGQFGEFSNQRNVDQNNQIFTNMAVGGATNNNSVYLHIRKKKP